MAKHKHIPQRTCIACRQRSDKRLLTRLVRTPDAGIIVDPTGKRKGRGAYLCHEPDCWDKALKGRLLSQALRTQISDAELQALLEQRPVAEYHE